MYRCLGAPRDPFEDSRDETLAWEPLPRGRALESAAAALRAGAGVWVRGDPGAGRGWLLARLAEDLVAEGRRVLFREGPAPQTGIGLLDALLEIAGPSDEDGDLLDRAGALYRRLLEAFVAAGPTAIVPATEFPLPSAPLEELEILAGLRVAGRPLVRLALAGEGPTPVEGLVEVVLPSPAAADLHDFLSRRMAACGCPDLLPRDEVDRIARAATGLGDALRLARQAVARRAYRLPDAAGGRSEAAEGRAASVLDADELGEVDRLLTDLAPDPAAPESF